MNKSGLANEMHPGRTIAKDVLKPLNLSVSALAREIHIPATRLNDIVRGRRGVTADTALRLARYLDTSPQFWVNLQANYELRMAELQSGKLIRRQVKPKAA